MMSPDPTRGHLQERVANSLRKIEELELAYQTTTLGQLVSMRARTHGSALAIDIFERGERATYAQMDRRSNSCAHALRRFGVRKGDRVGMMLPNRIEFPVLWFALAKLGAVMVPINMYYTPREVDFVLRDTQAKFAIVDESAWPTFTAMNPWPPDLAKERVVLVGNGTATATTLHEVLEGVESSPVDENVQPDDLLTIQHTSGTTGFPKGCMLTHDYWGVCSYVYAYLDYHPYKRHLSWSSPAYSYWPNIFLKSYRQGGTLYLAQEMNWSRFIDWLEEYRIEWCALPRLIAETAHQVPRCLKQVSQYDGWSADTIRRFREQFGVPGHCPFGMTEIGYGMQLSYDLEEMTDTRSIGICSPFRNLRLVNDDGSPTPVGGVGELWVSGRGIFKGYWNDPEANAEAFEGEWFKTGDLMRRDELGFYWFVGRRKDVIRRWTENIAAREVEAIIGEIPEIADVAAVPVPDDKRGEEVKIYVELREGITPASLPIERILEHARKRLAAFKVPRYIAFTPALPRTTSSNKVLKRDLLTISDPLSGAYDCEEKRWR
ncbi:acyl--CoA ligase [Bradyrhizobium sp. 30]|nr:acyl--CoA ligase [Bradyrhizobium sp. 30]